MANVIIDDTYLSDIADAIRAKTGGSDTFTPAQMATAIGDLQTGSAMDWTSMSRSAQEYGGRTKCVYTSSTPYYIRGFARESATGADLATTFKNHAFVIALKQVQGSSNYYSYFIWTPMGYLYEKSLSHSYWRPSYFLSPSSMDTTKLPLNDIWYNGLTSSSYMPALKISEIDNNTAEVVWSVFATASEAQISLYQTTDGTSGTLNTSMATANKYIYLMDPLYIL